MPLDPTLANGFAPLKLDDPMDQMGKVLTNAMMMDKMSDGSTKRRKAKAYNELYAQFAKPDGSVDWDGMEYKAAQTGLGDIIPDIKDDRLKWDKGRAEIGATEAKTKGDIASTTKTKTESQSKFDENYATTLAGVSNFEQLKSRVLQAYKNDIAYSVYGSVENANAAAKNDLMEAQAAEAKGPNEFAKWIARRVVGKDSFKHSYQLVGEKDKQTLLATNDYGTPGAAPVKTFGAKPVREGVNVKINMPGQESVSEFDKVVGKGQGESFLKLQEAALGAPARVRDIDRTISLIDSGKVFTGTGAEPKLEAIRIANMLGVPVDKDLIRNTEEVIAGLVQNTLTGISRFEQMGVSLTPMSDKDLQMFRDASPQIKNSPEMIKRLLRVERQLYQDSVKMFNQRRNAVTSNPRTSPTIKAMSIDSLPEIPNVVPKTAPQWRAGITGVNGKPINQRQFNELLATPSDAAEFDNHFGPGSAARILGGAPTGDRPLPR